FLLIKVPAKAGFTVFNFNETYFRPRSEDISRNDISSLSYRAHAPAPYSMFPGNEINIPVLPCFCIAYKKD
ncbi:hypothetical protein L9F63_007270, partial [Diploptera punctata]